MKITKTTLKKSLYNALRQECGYAVPEAKRIIEQSVWTKDPYGWSSGADFTISTEDGIPSYDNWKFWNIVGDKFDAMFEPVNCGVMAVYKD